MSGRARCAPARPFQRQHRDRARHRHCGDRGAPRGCGANAAYTIDSAPLIDLHLPSQAVNTIILTEMGAKRDAGIGPDNWDVTSCDAAGLVAPQPGTTSDQSSGFDNGN